jgi:hypothetical protein
MTTTFLNDYNLKNNVTQPNKMTPNDDNPYNFNGTVNFGAASFQGQQIGNLLSANTITNYSTATAIAISGQAVIAGGTGLAMTLAAPTLGCVCSIFVLSLSSGAVTVKTPSGVTFDGTNNTATFSTAGLVLKLGYTSATRWNIAYNTGATFSST